MSTYAFLDADRVACLYTREGRHHLAVLRQGEGLLEDLDVPYTLIWPALRAREGRLYFVAASPTEAAAAVVLDPATGKREILRRSFDLDVDRAFVSVPRPVSFPTEQGMVAHGLFYPPANPEFAGKIDALADCTGGPCRQGSAPDGEGHGTDHCEHLTHRLPPLSVSRPAPRRADDQRHRSNREQRHQRGDHKPPV